MLFTYYLQSTPSKRSLKCPEDSLDQYFEVIRDLTAMDIKTARAALHSGICINLKTCKFFALPMGRL